MLIAAAARAADVSGLYTLRNAREMGSELLLKPDGSFEFMLAYGAADYWSKGTWKSESGAVTLNSDDPEPKPPFRLLSSTTGNKEDSPRVTLVAAGGRPVPNIDVVLEGAGGTSKARTGSDGVAHFAPVKSPRSAVFQIRVYEFESPALPLNPEHNEFRFEIDGREITKVRFHDEKLAIDGGSLMLRYAGVDRPMRYTKE